MSKKQFLVALSFVVILWCMVMAEFLTSCTKTPTDVGVYELTYVVFYPNYPDTVTVQVKSDYPFESMCNRGDNYIRAYGAGTVISTSAPLKIIKQIKIK